MMRYIGVIFLVIISLTGGCSRRKVDIEKEILASDPGFSSVLEKKKEVLDELNTVKSKYRSQKARINEQMDMLNNKRAELKSVFLANVETIRSKMDPEKRELEKYIVEDAKKLRAKNLVLKHTDKDIDEINELIGKKDSLALTQEEIRTWNERLSALLKNKDEIIQDIAHLKEDIRITKLKIKSLKIK